MYFDKPRDVDPTCFEDKMLRTYIDSKDKPKLYSLKHLAGIHLTDPKHLDFMDSNLCSTKQHTPEPFLVSYALQDVEITKRIHAYLNQDVSNCLADIRVKVARALVVTKILGNDVFTYYPNKHIIAVIKEPVRTILNDTLKKLTRRYFSLFDLETQGLLSFMGSPRVMRKGYY